ncbi:hypothetical protein IWZ00DRAFT_543198 [Phyllosticta capitalensis]|uniref:Uncharacterized protein n=1 Tax=Phyllosticta capitalensis TaxID=121624 RepID=A0ABR1YS07_9PEZI
MKPLFLSLLALLPIALAVPAPQDSNTQCTCPPPTCPQEEPAGCECRNKAILDCSDQKQAAGLPCPVPAIAACPKGRTTTNEPPPQKPKEKPPPAVKPNPNFKCPCEEVYCIQSYPESCECENRNKRECFDNCGGLEPTYDDRCGFGDETPPPKTNPEPNPNPNPPPRRNPYLETPGPVISPEGLPPVENGGGNGDDGDQSKACREQEKEEEKERRKKEKEERKRKKDEEKGCTGGCKEGEECVDIIFEKVGGGSETRKGCLPKKS